MNLRRVWLGLVEYNQRAGRAYEKCGFRVEGRPREAKFRNGRYRDEIVMGILDREFRARQQLWKQG